jgi:hypothetical protein
MTYTILLAVVGLAGAVEAPSHVAAHAVAAEPVFLQQQGNQGNRPAQAQQNRNQQGNRPAQAQQGRAQQGNQPAQAQQNRNQQGNRPAQAQQGQQGNRPAQAQQNRGPQGNQPPQAQQGRGQGNQPPQAQQGRGQGNQPGQAQQGRGQGNQPGQAQQGRGQGNQPGQAQSRGRGGVLTAAEVNQGVRALPQSMRQFPGSQRSSERMVAGATARGIARGLDPAMLDVRTQGQRVIVANRRGDVLFDLDERHARQLGYWELRRLGDRRPNGNAPAFCRSGEGHPVWGREWCLDRGFGLGSRNGTIWSRTRVEDVVFGRPTSRDRRDRLDRGGLIDVLGDVVLGRLALHALTMGYVEPLHGTWVSEPNAPQILYVRSGDVVVAEFVDLNRNDRVDVLYVIQPL